jgi:ABC-type polar amino acid transport system ATPase subunit
VEGGIRMTRALEIRGLVVRRGARTIVNGIDLDVERGQIVALMGLSGSGKTTILRAIAGLEPFDGTIRVDGRAGLVFQDHCLFGHLSAIDNVRLAPRHVDRAAAADARVRAEQLLADLGVGHRAGAWPRELSGGEAQRVAIARALAMDPVVLLLDEPTASLDPARRGDLGRTLRRLADAGRSLLVTSHDDEFVETHADRVTVLAEGLIAETGSPGAVLRNPSHEATRALLQVERRHRDVPR